MIRACAIVNILIGVLGVLAGVHLTLLVIGFGGPGAIVEAVGVLGPLALAGGLLAWFGVCLFRSKRVSSKTVALVGSAIALTSIYCAVMFAILSPTQRSVHHEIGLIFLFIHMCVVLGIVGEFVYLWRQWRRDIRE
ncbi:MAG: hypothetical protein HQ567_13535 [Candidatus Nealsonbacteria bacterium]|nr:hypothetical protein [Candidatus Nealsonbacteria bacterium]